ncbi:hydantoinase/oxoprolinase family protein [Herbiconiux sp.]|uniref:hydantoinase/oxoprolinase family protein n=1 Tax=Herbiconiux sp. TaxID=1871186 RepID=UPI0025BE0654|nr:hydantoinase/oxoprolinase family protein [Herbiconiux sp.]
MAFRISVDTGGTFTDVVITDADGGIHIGKALTTYQRAFDGVSTAVEQVASRLGLSVRELLADTSHFAYGTTRSTNAIVEKKTAVTALFTTAGFPDTLLLREGGRLGGAFSPREFEPPYVPRYLTFEIGERIDSDGTVHQELDESTVISAIRECRRHGVEAIGVSLLWSTVNAAHELAVDRMLAEHMPEVPRTLSHRLNPVLREYRRTSSTVIDASLKPLMQSFLAQLSDDLVAAGFTGRLLISTSYGGSWPVGRMADRPIYSVGSGPSMAPIAALHAGRTTLAEERPNVLVCDTGGTTFDVGLISDGTIHFSADTWLGQKWTGHITGTKSVDVRSIGAGGGSIISVDSSGLVRVGPESAGADPGPACYGRGGIRPTVTDAALVLGYFDPIGFIGGTLSLDVDAARAALQPIADRLGTSVEHAARGALVIASQNIVSAVREMTISQGVDPRDLSIIAGGGASGVNIVQIARELGVGTVVLPKTAGALSAAGALNADLISDFTASAFTTTRSFDAEAAAGALASLAEQAQQFVDEIDSLAPVAVHTQLSVDARYPGQVWELETPVTLKDDGSVDLEALEAAFHAHHLRVFQVNDPSQHVECLIWKRRVTAELDKPAQRVAPAATGDPEPVRVRPVLFAFADAPETPVYDGAALGAGSTIHGPAIILEATTTLVVDPGATVVVAPTSDYIITTGSNDSLGAFAAREGALA